MTDVQILFGANDIKSIYEKALKEESIDFICLATNYEGVFGDWFDNEYANNLYGKVKTREILPDTKENRAYAKDKDAQINQVRFTGRTRSESDVICGKDWVALISYNSDNPLAVVVEEKELVKGLKQQFEEEWKASKR